MAKDKNKPAEAPSRSTIVDENNLPEVLKGQAVNVEMYDVIKKELDEEADKNKRDLIKRRYQKALYRNGQALLERKRAKALADEVTLYKVRQMTRLLRLLVGTSVDEKTLEYAKTPDDIWKKEVLSKDGKSIETTLPDGSKKTFKEGETIPPVIDVVDFDNMAEQLENELRNRRKKVDDQYETDLKKWDLQFGEYWDRSWRW